MKPELRSTMGGEFNPHSQDLDNGLPQLLWSDLLTTDGLAETASGGGAGNLEGALRGYGDRSLAMASPKDYHATATPEWALALAHSQRELGFPGLSPDHIIPVETLEGETMTQAALRDPVSVRSMIHEVLSRKDRKNPPRLQPFYLDHETEKLARQLKLGLRGEAVSTHWINGKDSLDDLSRAGLAVPTTRRVQSVPQLIDLYGWFCEQGMTRVVLKPIYGASGLGVVTITSFQELMEKAIHNPAVVRLIQSPHNGYIMQRFLDGFIASPSFVFELKRSGIQPGWRYSLQLLAKENPNDPIPTVHKGSTSAPDCFTKFPGFEDSCLEIAQYYHSIGARGRGGMDFVFSSKPGYSYNLEDMLKGHFDPNNIEYGGVDPNFRIVGWDHTGESTNRLKMEMDADRRRPNHPLWFVTNNNVHVPSGVRTGCPEAILHDMQCLFDNWGVRYNPYTKTGMLVANAAATNVADPSAARLMVHAFSTCPQQYSLHREILAHLSENA